MRLLSEADPNPRFDLGRTMPSDDVPFTSSTQVAADPDLSSSQAMRTCRPTTSSPTSRLDVELTDPRLGVIPSHRKPRSPFFVR